MSKQKISEAIKTMIKMLYFDKFLCDTSRNTVRFDTRIKIKTNNFCFVLIYIKGKGYENGAMVMQMHKSKN